MNEENLIFIISQPRSGSTYLQNLLSNNTEVNTCSEPWILLNFANHIKPELVEATFNNKLANKVFQNYLSKYPEIELNIAIKNLLLDLYAPMAKGYNFVIDKTPRYWELMDELVELFPKSKFIILKRNPIDVVTSIIKTWNIKNLLELNEYRRDLLLAPKQIHTFCEKNKNNKNVYTLRYEDLTANPIDEVKKLYDWIGISFSSSVLNTENNSKYKGIYGDPYQNSEVGYTHAKAASHAKKLTPEFVGFLNGYVNYLREDFLLEYGNYKVKDLKPKKTRAFSQFVLFSNERAKNYVLKKELKYFIKQVFFSLFK